MTCLRCRAELPEIALYCHACGQHQRSEDVARRQSYAVKPDEPVACLRLFSTVMPRGSVRSSFTYRVVLGIALLLATATAAFGFMPLALMAAAFAIPVVYIVYLYDVNQWEDEPILVTLLAFLLSFALGGALIWATMKYLPRHQLIVSGGELRRAIVPFGLVAALVIIPVVGEIIRELGPILLACRPEFDDLMDGLTFGVISGVGFAAAETLVAHRGLFAVGFSTKVDALSMISLMILHGFIKPILYGTATGLACAEFSGLGRGYDGFTGRYFRSVIVAIFAVGIFSGGLYFLDMLGSLGLALFLEIVLGLVLIAVLIVVLRHVLHLGLMEAAMEASARFNGAASDLRGSCSGCEMPLVSGAAFCSICGKATSAGLRTGARIGVAPARAVDSTVSTGGLTNPEDAYFDHEETTA